MIAIIVIFIAGYLCIACEHVLKINKTATALVTGILCWVALILNSDREEVVRSLSYHVGELSQILFFLLGAMTIVELIDAHDGFEIITGRIRTRNKKKLAWIIGFLAFFLSAVLDNLTTAIVMVSLVRKLVSDKNDRMLFAGLIILSANAGGAWSPIGDVTTTMLWIGGQVTAPRIIVRLLLPGLVCMLVPLLIMQLSLKGFAGSPVIHKDDSLAINERHRHIVFFSGIGILLLVPVFKMVTHLPPFMGILLGLGLLWIIVEMLHSEKDEADRQPFTVAHALRKIDSSSILFFLGILLAVTALESAGHLRVLAQAMDEHIGNPDLIVLAIGLLSSVVDNVPLVAATMGMYSLEQFPTDHSFWEFLAYASGTGGSILVIGSAAGVAAMGIDKIPFIWYLKKISWLALIGYLAGAAVYLVGIGL